jgi:hypothetical protein
MDDELVVEHRAIEDAIDAYVAAGNDIGVFVTGWIFVASLSSPVHDGHGTDGYATISSNGLPHHAQVGLLSMATDEKKNMSMMATLRNIMREEYDEDEDYEEDE